MRQISLVGEDKVFERLTELGDRLEWLDRVVDWSIFLPLLKKAKPDNTGDKGGRPPYPLLMMFKIVILQEINGMANDATEFMLNDRLSWKRFVGLGLSDRVPDGSTIWLFREALKEQGIFAELFFLFNRKMEEMEVITHKGSIVDASFVEAPRQRNSRKENETIKNGDVPEEWEQPEQANKLRQKDMDASWAGKNGQLYFGYKDHVLCDVESKMIVDFLVSTASVHDSQPLLTLLERSGPKLQALWADSAYTGKQLHSDLQTRYPNLYLHINEKGYRGIPLSEDQKTLNREKSRVRARVEHIFGHMAMAMGGKRIRSIGRRRACLAIGLKNLVYNLTRYVTLVLQGKAVSMV